MANWINCASSLWSYSSRQTGEVWRSGDVSSAAPNMATKSTISHQLNTAKIESVIAAGCGRAHSPQITSVICHIFTVIFEISALKLECAASCFYHV